MLNFINPKIFLCKSGPWLAPQLRNGGFCWIKDLLPNMQIKVKMPEFS